MDRIYLVCFLYVLYVCNLEFIFTVFFIGSIYDNVVEDVEEHSRLGISTSS